MSLEAIRYSPGRLDVLDQLQLPHVSYYDAVPTSAAAFDCIRSMRVRGAPAIAIVASLALAVELANGGCTATTPAATIAFIDDRLDYLFQSRPTAVDLGNAIAHLKQVVRAVPGAASTAEDPVAAAAVRDAYIAAAEAILRRDLQTNRAIGEHGAAWLQKEAGAGVAAENSGIALLTHCNTGSLATSGHGTALGIIRSLHARGGLRHAFCTETRPYNQGSRLTAYELVYEGIPSTLITDSMAGALMAGGGAGAGGEVALAKPFAVVVGADRVARNGDTANKIGTYALAVLARHHGVRFVVAAPTTSIDRGMASGQAIQIEQRRAEELTQVTGPVVGEDGKVTPSQTARVATADQRIAVWNPAFDVTPAALIDVIVTEKGAVEKGADGTFDLGDL